MNKSFFYDKNNYNKKIDKEYLDSDCSIILENRNLIKTRLDNTTIYKLASLLPVREVDGKIVRTSEFVLAYIYIDGVDPEKRVAIAQFIIEIYLVDNLKIKLLLSIDILGS